VSASDLAALVRRLRHRPEDRARRFLIPNVLAFSLTACGGHSSVPDASPEEADGNQPLVLLPDGGVDCQASESYGSDGACGEQCGGECIPVGATCMVPDLEDRDGGEMPGVILPVNQYCECCL
jgi:hypothetical protein